MTGIPTQANDFAKEHSPMDLVMVDDQVNKHVDTCRQALDHFVEATQPLTSRWRVPIGLFTLLEVCKRFWLWKQVRFAAWRFCQASQDVDLRANGAHLESFSPGITVFNQFVEVGSDFLKKANEDGVHRSERVVEFVRGVVERVQERIGELEERRERAPKYTAAMQQFYPAAFGGGDAEEPLAPQRPR